MVVCHCLAVNDRRIRAAIDAGALDVDAITAACGAGGRCGGCRPVLETLVASAGASVTIRTGAVAA